MGCLLFIVVFGALGVWFHFLINKSDLFFIVYNVQVRNVFQESSFLSRLKFTDTKTVGFEFIACYFLLYFAGISLSSVLCGNSKAQLNQL